MTAVRDGYPHYSDNEREPMDYQTDAPCPLDGIRVLDLTRVVAGNMLSMLLADFGAEVVKVEAPGRGDTLREWKEDGIPVFWKVYGRNKKSVTLDIRKPSGKEILQKLVTGSQVLLENFRPGVLERLGFSPEELHRLNPDLVIVRVSGWGRRALTARCRGSVAWWKASPASLQRTVLRTSRRRCRTWRWRT